MDGQRRGYDRTVNTPAGGSGNVARAGDYNTCTGGGFGGRFGGGGFRGGGFRR